MSLVKVDRLIRPQHALLEEDDDCFFFGDYTARKGCNYSSTNQLIFNFKKSVERRGRPEYIYKARAIQQVASQFRQALAGTAEQQQSLRAYTLVPMPPSKAKTDPLYDDRLVQMLAAVGRGLNLDIRELLVSHQTMQSSHGANDRPTINAIHDNMTVDESAAVPPPQHVVLFDDTLVSGAHFKAAQRLLRERFPRIPVTGMFIARRTLDADDV